MDRASGYVGLRRRCRLPVFNKGAAVNGVCDCAAAEMEVCAKAAPQSPTSGDATGRPKRGQDQAWRGLVLPMRRPRDDQRVRATAALR